MKESNQANADAFRYNNQIAILDKIDRFTKLRDEAKKLEAEADKLYAKADKLWIDAYELLTREDN